MHMENPFMVHLSCVRISKNAHLKGKWYERVEYKFSYAPFWATHNSAGRNKYATQAAEEAFFSSVNSTFSKV